MRVRQKTTELKRRLFREGVAAATKVLGSDDTYYCPICGDGFREDALQDDKLTLEHVPPKALGGKAITLTCKRCNNTAGHTIDAEAASRSEQLRFAQTLLGKREGYGGRAVMTIAGEKLQTELHHNDSTIDIRVVGKANNPHWVRRTQDYFDELAKRGAGKGETFTLTAASSYHVRLARISDLRCAFLACTAALGYEFALAPALRRIREQIRNPEETTIARWWARLNAPMGPQISISENEGVIIVTMGAEAVVLPYPPSGEDTMDEFFERHGSTEGFKLPAAPVGWPGSFVAKVDHAARDKSASC